MIKKALLIILFLILLPVTLAWGFTQYSTSNLNIGSQSSSQTSSNTNSGVLFNAQPIFDGEDYLNEGYNLYKSDSNSNRVDTVPYRDTEGYTIDNFDKIANDNFQNSYKYYSEDGKIGVDVNQGYKYFLADSEYAVYDDPKYGEKIYLGFE